MFTKASLYAAEIGYNNTITGQQQIWPRLGFNAELEQETLTELQQIGLMAKLNAVTQGKENIHC